MCIHVNVRIDKPSFLRFGRSYSGHAKTVTQPWFVNVCQAKLLPLRKRFSSLEVEVMPKVWIPVVAPEGLAASLNGALMGQFRHWGVVSQKELGETLAGKLPARYCASSNLQKISWEMMISLSNPVQWFMEQGYQWMCGIFLVRLQRCGDLMM